VSRKPAYLLVIFTCLALGLIAMLGIWLARRSILNAKPAPPPLIFPTRPIPSSPTASASRFETPSPLPLSTNTAGGKIVYVCQIFRVSEADQICIMNSDGSDQRRLTTSDTARHYYPSLAPDGQSVLFSSNMDGTNFYIYELKLTGELTNLWQPGVAPEVSPDGRLIAFTQSDGKNDMIWVMNRDGSNPRLLYSNGWDPTWSPDGQKILFASQVNGLSQLMTINLDGSGLQQVSNLPLLRGRSDWSADGRNIVTYSGRAWERELFLLPLDGSPLRQLTPPGGNSQGPTFSPDGQWVAFTGYFDRFGNAHGCEIYKMKIDGTGLTRLTNNNYCDWQPRWGP